MNDILRWAKEADLWMTSDERIAAVERFAALVRADEREQCALLLERGVDLVGLAEHPAWQNYTAILLTGCAAAIRTRKES
jgi:hypothetical protein